MNKDKLIHIGTFVNPRGLKGEIKILLYLSNFEMFESLIKFLVDEKKNSFNFEYIKLIKGRAIGKLKKLNDRNSVDLIKNKKIFIERKFFPKNKENNFYFFDLIDFKIITNNKKILGTVESIENFGAGDLINVKDNSGKYFYIPMNNDNVIEVDTKKEKIIVSPIKGILN